MPVIPRPVVLFWAVLLLAGDSFSKEPQRRMRTFGRPPAWIEQSWFMRRQIDEPLVLTGGTLIDVRSGATRPATVVVQGDRIASIGDAAPPPDATVIDISDHYVIPGLFDLHAHVIPPSPFFDEALPPEQALATLIEWGVTTIRLLPFHSESAVALAGQVATGDLVGPTIVPASGIFEREAQRTSRGFQTPANAAAWVRKEALLGARWIKVYNRMDEQSLGTIVAAARAHGMRVCGHTEDVPPHRAAELGIACLEHVISLPLSCLQAGARDPNGLDLAARTTWRWEHVDEQRLTELLALLRSKRVAWVPTLAVSEQMIRSGAHDGEPLEDADDAAHQEALQRAARTVVRFHREGGLVGLGTDFPVDGVPAGESVHRELELLVRLGGATPREALEIATIGSARVLGHDQVVGELAPDRLANLVVLRANPLQDIRHTRQIAWVIHEGRVRRTPPPRTQPATSRPAAAPDE